MQKFGGKLPSHKQEKYDIPVGFVRIDYGVSQEGDWCLDSATAQFNPCKSAGTFFADEYYCLIRPVVNNANRVQRTD